MRAKKQWNENNIEKSKDLLPEMVNAAILSFPETKMEIEGEERGQKKLS